MVPILEGLLVVGAHRLTPLDLVLQRRGDCQVHLCPAPHLILQSARSRYLMNGDIEFEPSLSLPLDKSKDSWEGVARVYRSVRDIRTTMQIELIMDCMANTLVFS